MTFTFSFIVVIALLQDGALQGILYTFICVFLFKDRKYGSYRKIEILNQDSIVVFWITEACFFKLYNLFYSYSEYLFLSLCLGLTLSCVMRFPV